MKNDRIKLISTILIMVTLAGYLGWRVWDRFQRPAASVNLPTKADYDRIEAGMTTAEVEAVLGEPGTRVDKADMPEDVRANWKEDMWVWGGRRQFGMVIRVYFKDGKVSRKESDGLK